MPNFRSALIALSILILFAGGCRQRSPKRDHIPLIKAAIVRLQEGVKAQNQAAIDSVLSTRILDKGQSSDSLLKYVYGSMASLPFEQFGKTEIVYTKNRARVDCFIMDSLHTEERPFTIFMIYEHDLWLVSSFVVGRHDTLIDTAKT